MNEPRFNRQRLAEVLQKAAELQEGRADPAATDVLALHQIASQARVHTSGESATGRASWWTAMLKWLRAVFRK
ncbi:MAG: hypothetical protein ACT4O1_14835 [Gemmatimonadota bacterium]